MERRAAWIRGLTWASIITYCIAIVLPALRIRYSVDGQPPSDPLVMTGWECLNEGVDGRTWFWWANPALGISWILLWSAKPFARIFTIAALCGGGYILAAMFGEVLAGGWMWLLSMLLADFGAVLSFLPVLKPRVIV